MEGAKKRKAENQEVKSFPTYSASLDLTHLPPSDVSVLHESFETIFPSFSPQENNVIDFLINGSSDHYIDLQNTYFYFRMKVQDRTNARLTTASKTSLANNIFSTMFQSLDVYVNNVSICSGSNQYPYAAYLQRVLNWDKATIDRLGKFEGFFKETKETAVDATNEAYKALRVLANKDSFEIYGKLNHPLFQQCRMIPPNTNVRIRLRKSPNTFHLLADSLTVNSTFGDHLVIMDTFIDCRRAIIKSEIEQSHKAVLEKNGRLFFPYYEPEVISYNVASGTLSHTSDTLLDFLPPLVVVGLVKSTAYNGSVNLSPFKFEPHGLSGITLLLNGENVNFQGGMKINTDDNQYSRIFRHLVELKGSGGGYPDISETDFLKNGYFLIPLNWASEGKEDRLRLKKEGQLKIQLSFSSGLVSSVTAIVYYLAPRTLSFTKDNVFVE